MSDQDREQNAARRWRLVLGGEQADGLGWTLGNADVQMDRALQALSDSDKRGGLGSSAPSVARWLGDIREYFPSSVVQVMQRDAIERLDIKNLLMEPEMLETLEPDVHLVADLPVDRRPLPLPEPQWSWRGSQQGRGHSRKRDKSRGGVPKGQK